MSKFVVKEVEFLKYFMKIYWYVGMLIIVFVLKFWVDFWFYFIISVNISGFIVFVV